MADDAPSLSDFLFLLCDDVHEALLSLTEFVQCDSPILLEDACCMHPCTLTRIAGQPPDCRSHASSRPAPRGLSRRAPQMSPPSSRHTPALRAALNAGPSRPPTRTRDRASSLARRAAEPMPAAHDRPRGLFDSASQSPAPSPARRAHTSRRRRSRRRRRTRRPAEDAPPRTAPARAYAAAAPVVTGLARFSRKFLALRDRGRAIFSAHADVARNAVATRRSTPRASRSDGRPSLSDDTTSPSFESTSGSDSNFSFGSESSHDCMDHANFNVDSHLALSDDDDCDCICNHRPKTELLVARTNTYGDRMEASYTDLHSSSSSDTFAGSSSGASSLSAPNRHISYPQRCEECEWSDAHCHDGDVRAPINTPTRATSASGGRLHFDTSPLSDCFLDSANERGVSSSTHALPEIYAQNLAYSFDSIVVVASDDDDDDDDEDDDDSWTADPLIRRSPYEMPILFQRGHEQRVPAHDVRPSPAIDAVIREAVLASDDVPLISDLELAEEVLLSDRSEAANIAAVDDLLSFPTINELVEEEEELSNGHFSGSIDHSIGEWMILNEDTRNTPSITELLDTDRSSDESVIDADSLDFSDSDHSVNGPLHEFYIAGALNMLSGRATSARSAASRSSTANADADGAVRWDEGLGAMEAILAYDSTDETRQRNSDNDNSEERGRAVAAGANSTLRIVRALREHESSNTQENDNAEILPSYYDSIIPDLEALLSSDDDEDTDDIDWALLDLDVPIIRDTLTPTEMQAAAPSQSLPISSQGATCVICTDDIGVTPARILPCSREHVFHTKCVDTWASHNATCPTCRAPIAEAADQPRDAPRPRPASFPARGARASPRLRSRRRFLDDSISVGAFAWHGRHL